MKICNDDSKFKYCGSNQSIPSFIKRSNFDKFEAVYYEKQVPPLILGYTFCFHFGKMLTCRTLINQKWIVRLSVLLS